MDRRARRILLILAALFAALLGFGQASAQNPPRSFSNDILKAVPTFHSIGLYWFRPNAGAQVTVKFRPLNTAVWRDGLPLWYDGRNSEYRSSLVDLTPGTTYEIQLIEGSTITPLQATTWSETFSVPEDSTYTIPVPASGIKQINIGTGPVPKPTNSTAGGVMTVTLPSSGQTGYVLITGTGPTTRSTVDGAGVGNCININGASKVVLRWLRIVNCEGPSNLPQNGGAGIFIRNGAHDIVIDGNEITNWGRWGTDTFDTTTGNRGRIILTQYPSTDGAIMCDTGGDRIIVQRNVIHEPHYSATHWFQNPVPQPANHGGGTRPAEVDLNGHPQGPQAWMSHTLCGSNLVIRYNDIFGKEDPTNPNNNRFFNDGLGGWDNMSFTGFPFADTDIYANRITHAYDDAIEAEGGDRNVRIWGNYTSRSLTAVANVVNRIGPLYVWRNVSDDMALIHNPAGDADKEPRGPFVKGGNDDGHLFPPGRAYYFHNTTLQPPPHPGFTLRSGAGAGLRNTDGQLFNFESKNNIWHAAHESINANCNLGFCQSDFDLYSGNVVNAGPTSRTNGESWRAATTPTYASSNSVYPNQTAQPGNFSLAPGTPGVGQATRINNFNDQYASADVGAHQSGTSPMKFGVAAGDGAGADMSAQVPVLDDFEDGDSTGWTTVGNWAVVQDGASKALKQTDLNGGRASLDVSNWPNQMVEADVKAESFNGVNGWAGLFVRYQDPNNTYYITLRNDNTLSLRKIVGGTTTVFGSYQMTVSPGTTYRLRLEAVGQTLNVYVNGAQVLPLTATDATFSSGRAAVGTSGAVALFDNVLVTPTPLNEIGWRQDNFKDGDSAGWTQIGTTPWTVTSGAFTQSDTTGSRAVRAETYWRDQSIESDVRITGVGSGAAWAGLFVRFTDQNNTYYVTLRHGDNQLILKKIVSGVITDLALPVSFQVGMNTTYKMRLEVTGFDLKVYVDGALKIQATDPGASLVAGRTGVGNLGASTQFDSIVMSARAPTVVSDNFDDGDANGWTPGGVQSWSVVTDGSPVYKQSIGTDGAFSTFPGSSPNQTIQARVKPLSFNTPDNWVGLAARYADFNNHYYITARSPLNELHLKKTVGGTFTTLQSVPFTIVTGVWYKLRLEVLDTAPNITELRVYVDNNDGTGWKLMIDYTDATPLTAGNSFGIRMFGATAEYDDVLVATP